MGKAKCRRNRPRLLLRIEQRFEPAVAIGLQDTPEGDQMLLGMLASSVARGVIDRRRRRGPGEGPVIPHIMRWTVPALIDCERTPKEDKLWL